MGTATFESYPLPGRHKAIPVGVFAPTGSGYAALPQVRCGRVEDYEGARPPRAVFRWVTDDRPGWPYPSALESLVPVDASGPGVLRADDRICVASLTPAGDLRWLFSGFVLPVGVGLTDRSEALGFEAVGDPVRLWDTPVRGSVWRPSDRPDVPDADVQTDLPARFNPDGRACFSADATDTPGKLYGKRGAFLDLDAEMLPADRVKVTLDAAVRYLAEVGNPEEVWVVNPPWEELVDDLTLKVPSGSRPVDPDDISTYQLFRPWVPDATVSGLLPFESIERVLGRLGFGFSFVLRTSASGAPEYTWRVYSLADPRGRAVKSVSLQRGGQLDRARTNLKGASIRRETETVVNAFRVAARPTEVECSLVLRPLFPISAADATPEAKALLFKTNPDPTLDLRKYRLWGVDECGEGHWDFAAGDISVVPADLSPLAESGVVVTRRRRPGGTIFSTTLDGRPRRAELCLLQDYAGPTVWDGSGTVTPVKSAWRLDEDSLSVWLDLNEAGAFSIGKQAVARDVNGGLVPQVDWLALSANADKRFSLLLTCVIGADMHPVVVAERLPSSPTRYTVTRDVQAEERHGERQVDPSSRFFDPAQATRGVVRIRKLKEDVLPELQARRQAHQVGPVAGSLEVPWLVNAIGPGDLVRRIEGRDCDLRANLGSSDGEPPVYPRVVARTWTLDDGQRTVLQLSSALPSEGGSVKLRS